MDHFSQAALFFRSQSPPKQNHLIDALRFELGKVERKEIRERMVGLLTQVDNALAAKVAAGLGMPVPAGPMRPMNHGVPADADREKYESRTGKSSVKQSAAISMSNTPKDS